MRIFHLADLHLGKSLYERDLVEDQRHALTAVLEAARTERPACVLIAGDVFDRAVPTAEAVTLLGQFVASLKAIDPELVIAMIPGNHDSAARLAFLAPVLATAAVYVASDAAACEVPVVVERGGQTLRLWLLPFLTPGAFSRPAPAPGEKPATAKSQPELFGDEAEPAPETAALRSQADLFAEAMRRIGAAMKTAKTLGTRPGAESGGGVTADASMDVLVCHAFAAGGASSESERAFLGTAELVDGRAFDDFNYVALGHLHRPQAVGTKGRYPGSILAYGFGEAGCERGFLSVELSSMAAVVEFRAVKPLRRMIRIEGTYDQVLVDPELEAFTGDYVEAVLDDAEAVLNPMDALRKRFPFILSLRQAAFERSGAAGPGYAEAKAPASITDDFAAFYREMLERDPDADETALFAELREEADHEAP
ncbi:MAG: hypothetical protein A2Y38_02395 [Spirochaetes bacterium GWB1_59_5]|nr:MAG: hypothetical protein A2Y38_02395 [Spirochaetes bacterium GWB1_59_5]